MTLAMPNHAHACDSLELMKVVKHAALKNQMLYTLSKLTCNNNNNFR